MLPTQKYGRIVYWLQSYDVSYDRAGLPLMPALTNISSDVAAEPNSAMYGADAGRPVSVSNWDEGRLFERANQVVARQPEAANPQPRAQQVQQMVRVLRDRHECEHWGSWRRIEGRHQCEECRYWLPQFILVSTVQTPGLRLL